MCQSYLNFLNWSFFFFLFSLTPRLKPKFWQTSLVPRCLNAWVGVCTYVCVLGNGHIVGLPSPSKSSKHVFADLFLFPVLWISFAFWSSSSLHCLHAPCEGTGLILLLSSPLGATNISILITPPLSFWLHPTFPLERNWGGGTTFIEMATFRVQSPEDSYVSSISPVESLHSTILHKMAWLLDWRKEEKLWTRR